MTSNMLKWILLLLLSSEFLTLKIKNSKNTNLAIAKAVIYNTNDTNDTDDKNDNQILEDFDFDNLNFDVDAFLNQNSDSNDVAPVPTVPFEGTVTTNDKNSLQHDPSEMNGVLTNSASSKVNNTPQDKIEENVLNVIKESQESFKIPEIPVANIGLKKMKKVDFYFKVKGSIKFIILF